MVLIRIRGKKLQIDLYSVIKLQCEMISQLLGFTHSGLQTSRVVSLIPTGLPVGLCNSPQMTIKDEQGYSVNALLRIIRPLRRFRPHFYAQFGLSFFKNPAEFAQSDFRCYN